MKKILKTINTFLQKKAKKIYNKLEKINFKSTGEKQVVNEIMKDLRKQYDRNYCGIVPKS